MRQVLLAESPLQKGSGVHARRTVRLEKHQVATVLLTASMKEMVKTYLK
jgi:hypothetical protein